MSDIHNRYMSIGKIPPNPTTLGRVRTLLESAYQALDVANDLATELAGVRHLTVEEKREAEHVAEFINTTYVRAVSLAEFIEKNSK